MSGMDGNEPMQTINKKLCDGTILIGYGKVGHGMNGKDADLSNAGQCLVKRLDTVDPVHADNMRIDIFISQYASVCEPYTDEMDEEAAEQANELAGEIVCTWTDYPGDWTGSDYWCFHTEVKLSINLTVEEYEAIEDGCAKTLELVGNRLSDKIYNGEELHPFEQNMTELNNAIAAITEKDGALPR
jgi:hypothetical protein